MSSQGESDKTPGIERHGEFGKSTRRTFLSRLGVATLFGIGGSERPCTSENVRRRSDR